MPLGDYIWGTDEVHPPERVGELLREKKFTLAVLESCTGGMIGAALTDTPGSSRLLRRRSHHLLQRNQGALRRPRRGHRGARRSE